jgi:hypothetical protein
MQYIPQHQDYKYQNYTFIKLNKHNPTNVHNQDEDEDTNENFEQPNYDNVEDYIDRDSKI